MIKVTRPKASPDKISHKDSFELCYLRHQYLRRAKYNPSDEDMKPFLTIAYHLSKNTYNTYQNLLASVGFELEDVYSIAQIHLVSFLGSFSLERMPSKYQDFVKVFKDLEERKPDEDDVLNKNQANFTLFLKQRMEDVVRVCRQKVRNIKGLPSDEFYHYCGSKMPPRNLRLLLKNHEKYGFRKIDSSVFKTVKRKAGLIHTTMFDFAGSYYIAVPLGTNLLGMKDLVGADLDPRESDHNMTPEERCLKVEEDIIIERRKEEFFAKPDDVKINIMKNFIRLNYRKKAYSEEVRAARKLLRTLE